MSLTERERTILQLASQGISDYKIARKINADPPNVTRSRKNAFRKLFRAESDLEWARNNGFKTEYFQVQEGFIGDFYSFFL